jgi:FkbM family methyltransferase
MSDYSQHGEQSVIVAHCGAPGVFLDIGANDGVTFSNTRALVDLGWKGVHVEPGTAAFAKLKQNFPNACAYQVAVSVQDGEATFYESDAKSQHMVSSLIESELQKWKCYTFATVQVKTVTVASLLKLAELSRVDFLSIDAEGSDLLIFRQFDLSALGVRLVCVEHNGSDITPFDTHAASHGMNRIFINAANSIYARL